MNLKTNPELKKHIWPLKPEEFEQLEQNILAEGIRDKIITWQGFIVDGHNRHEIAIKHSLPFETIEYEFENIEDVKDWMDANQIGRRNLTKDQWEISIGRRYNREKKTSETQKRGNRFTIVEGDQFDHPVKTSEKLADEYKVSPPTVRRYAQKAKEFEKLETEKPDVFEQVRAGNKTFTEVKKEEKKINFEKNKKEFEKLIRPKNINQVIIKGSCLDIIPTLDNYYDLLLTDPPYGMDFKSGWSSKDRIRHDKTDEAAELLDMALELSVAKLRDDAHFYIFGSIDYINIFQPIIEKYLVLKNILIWDRGVIGMGDLKTYGNSYDIIYFGFTYNWKNLNGVRDRDILSFNRIAPNKGIHQTEKPNDLLEYLIKKSTNEGDRILDPFAGGGSTLVAAKNTNRLCTGIEIMEENYQLINSRI